MKSVMADSEWWKTSIIYQIYPRSFKDSNNDGIGDLRGICSSLPYVKSLGIGAIWLNPIYKSPQYDMGYDVSDYNDVDPQYGNMEDFKLLIEQAHKLGIKVIMDFIPNHTSHQHEWFIKSEKCDPQYSDYYVWRDGKRDDNGEIIPPNNWITLFNEPAWTWSDKRQQFYLHQFLSQQPDLNYDNPQVRREIVDILLFWLTLGVDGFRCDAIAFLYELNYHENEPENPDADKYPEGHYDTLLHPNTRMLDEVYTTIREWSDTCNKFGREHNKDILLITEQYEPEEKITLLFDKSNVDLPFNFNLIGLKGSCDPQTIQRKINDWLSCVPEGKWSSWVLSNHDNKRIGTVFGEEMINALNLMLLTLPGTPTTYYGEELGLLDVHVKWEETQDSFGLIHGQENYMQYSRDGCRAPMLWDGAKNAGFTHDNVKPWLPIGDQLVTRNVQAQSQDPTSHLSFYKRVASLRQTGVFQTGEFRFYKVNDHILSYIRSNAAESCLILIVFKDLPEKSFKEMLTEFGENVTMRLKTRASLEMDSVNLQRGDAIVVHTLCC